MLFQIAELRGTDPVIVFPLSQSFLPVVPSTAKSTAGVAVSPVEQAKTTPLMTMGASGDFNPGNVQPRVRVAELPLSVTFQASTDAGDVESIHSWPLAAFRPAGPAGGRAPVPAIAGEVASGAPRVAPSKRKMRPSAV